MPTGPTHHVFGPNDEMGDCRCTLGRHHYADGTPHESDLWAGFDDEGSPEETLSVYEAANIWLSNGMDDDYTFGYSESDLRSAAGL